MNGVEIDGFWVVALLAEGVDRNNRATMQTQQATRSPSSRRAWIEINLNGPRSYANGVALLAEGVDRNNRAELCKTQKARSPSSRRAWIEIACISM